MLAGYRTYEFVFLGAMFLAILATPVTILFARRRRLVDQPGVRKVHAAAIPRLGGVAIVLATLAATLAVLQLDNLVGQALWQARSPVLTLLLASAFIFLLGLIDDIRSLGARTKFLGQLLAALAVVTAGARFGRIDLGGGWALELGWLGWPATMLWIVGVTNAVNLIDGLDGLAAGICTIASGAVALFAVVTGQPVLAVLMLAVLGSLVGFLFLNFNPARIFMGDCGSTFLGFLIASSAALCTAGSGRFVNAALPFVALGVPIFDTLFAILRRLLQRRGIMSPDRGHIHHRLLDAGLGHHQVALTIYAITLALTALGLFMMVTEGLRTLVVFGGLIVLLVLVFRIFGAVRLRETLAGARRTIAITREAKRQRREFESAELVLREATSFAQWWSGVCRAAEEMEFLRLSLALTNRDGSVRTLLWRRPGEDPPPHERIALTVPIRQRRQGGLLTAEVDVDVKGSLESAGRRVTLFGRLIDEHSLADLPRAPHVAAEVPVPAADAAPAGGSAAPGATAAALEGGAAPRR